MRRILTAIVLILLVPAMADDPESKLKKKLEGLVIESVKVEDMPLSDFVKRMRQLSIDADPKRSGVNFRLFLGDDQKAKDKQPKVTLDFENIPIGQLVRYVAEQTTCSYRLDGYSVSLHTSGRTPEPLLASIHKVGPVGDYMQQMDNPESGLTGMAITMGFTFPVTSRGEKAGLVWSPRANRVFLKNTKEQTDLFRTCFTSHWCPNRQLSTSLQVVEVHAPKHKLDRLESDQLPEFLAKLPKDKKRLLVDTNILCQSGQQQLITYGAPVDQAYLTAQVTMTSQAHGVAAPIHTNFVMYLDIWSSKEAMDRENRQDLVEYNPDILDVEILTEFSATRGESVVFKLAPARHKLGMGTLYAIVTQRVTDTDLGHCKH